ncbi:hypothetical protein ADS69_00097 [Enterobacter phage phiEap-3]|uniref:Uncharacterized protein n=1 Tax=Enterobacter phage phiEap-3 TaxID=1682394 RepID=A0A0K2FH92_9CAUD|nr:hypothetical protein FDI05_gp097 [Enterobacter phage phiEap-3]ALA45202.1 hypothetical protein ADS69_00097 [Enterobacter phage phiEap-3]
MNFNKNNKAISETITNKKHAIFITKYCEGVTLLYRRYAVIELSPCIYKTYKENNGYWERCDDLVSFLMWNGEFQGYDDITPLIK